MFAKDFPTFAAQAAKRRDVKKLREKEGKGWKEREKWNDKWRMWMKEEEGGGRRSRRRRRR